MSKGGVFKKEEDALRKFIRGLNVLGESQLALMNAAEELQFLQEICRIIVQQGGHRLAWVGFTTEGGGQTLLPVAQAGEEGATGDIQPRFLVDTAEGQCLTGAAMRDGRPAICQNTLTDEAYGPWRGEALAWGYASAIALPLTADKQVIGALNIYAASPNAFDPDEVDLLSKLAEIMGYGLMVLRTQTERRRIKAELAIKAQILNAAHDSILIQDLDGNLICSNETAWRERGYTRGELLQLPPAQLEPPEYAARSQAHRQELLNQGEVVYESVHLRRDRSLIPVQVHAKIIDLADRKVVLNIIRNLGDEKRLRQQLEHSHRDVSLFFNNPQVGVFRVRHADGKILDSNLRLAQMFGYRSREKFIEEFILAEQLVESEGWENLPFKDGELANCEARFHRRDGSIVHLLFSLRSHSDEGGLVGVATDITALRQAEENLKQSEVKYHALVEQLAGRSVLYALERNRHAQETQRERELSQKIAQTCEEGVLAFDKELRLTLWNLALQAITGISQQKALGKNLFKILPVLGELQEENGPLFGSLPRKNLFRFENPRKLAPAGREGIFVGHYSPLLTDAGEVNGGILVIRDVTLERQGQRAFRESETLANIFMTLRDGLVILDSGYTILQVNPAVEKNYPQPLVGRKCYEVFQGRSEPCEECPTRHTLATGKEGQGVVARKDAAGKTLGWVDLHTYPLKDPVTGQTVAVLEHATDVTRSLEAATCARESQERYGLLVNSLPALVIKAYPDWTVDFFDDKVEKLTGYTQADFTSRQVKWTDLILPEDRKRVEDIFAAALAGDQTYVRDYRVRTKDGRLIWLQESSQIIVDAAGQVKHISGVLFDITELKKSEEIQARLEAQLRQAQKMQAIGTLAGGIAHDFNNILGVMLGYAEMSLFSLKEEGPLKHRLQQILKAGQRGKDLVSQILTFSRPSKQSRNPVMVSSIVKETLKMLRATLPTTIELKHSLDNRHDTIMGDATQIHQVLLNLCANAAHAMWENGGVLDVDLTPVDLDEKEAAHYHDLAPGPHLRLRVTDTGHGMTPDILDRIFDPFFTTKKPGEGTGMGLAVVHGIVKAHNGAITVQSTPGHGTTFTVLLPRVETQANEKLAERAGVDEGHERILFVDDEEWLVEMWQEILEGLGFEVKATTSSLEALQAFRNDPDSYDLVITDQTMARLTGFELAREILKLRPELPVILCTGFSEVVNPEKAKALGIKEFIMKPLTINELTAAIRRALTGREEGVADESGSPV